MVKIENYDEGDAASAGAPRDGAMGPQADPTLAIAKPEEASQNTGSESSTSLGSLFDSDNEENSAPLMPRIEANQNIKPGQDSFSRSYLLSTMNFSKKEVDLAFSELGEEASLDQLVNWIVTAQEATNEGNAELLPGIMDKPLSLLQMGFTEGEVSSVIDIFGQEATVEELADSIFARRFANTTEQKQVINESDFPCETETGHSTYHQRLRYYDDDDDNIRAKKAKHVLRDDTRASSSQNVSQPSRTPWLSGCAGSIGNGSLKDEFLEMTSGPRTNIHGNLAKPPFFLYGNLVDISKDTWRQLSSFLFSVQPEFVNSQLFSALARKEGYIHNLPTERRHAVVPRSPLTIEDALPLTRQFWPSWDKRKQIAGVALDVAGTEQICEKLEKALRDSRGILSEEKQAQIVHKCKIADLIWTGQDRLGPLQPHQLERVLGYPANHTDLPGLNPQEKVAAMKFAAFQTDTVAYLFSVLKDMYPNGLRVLSLYSGVGGAEVALHRLGIPLRCVVSVEESEVNRRILRRWWGKTQQTGQLRQLPSIQKLKANVLEDLMKDFGGFDLIVGGNYSPYRGTARTVNTTMGMDSNQFFEYVRVVQMVRSTQGVVA